MGEYRILEPDELMHYGVKGMKWGKTIFSRRYRSTGGITSRNKNTYRKNAISDRRYAIAKNKRKNLDIRTAHPFYPDGKGPKIKSRLTRGMDSKHMKRERFQEKDYLTGAYNLRGATTLYSLKRKGLVDTRKPSGSEADKISAKYRYDFRSDAKTRLDNVLADAKRGKANKDTVKKARKNYNDANHLLDDYTRARYKDDRTISNNFDKWEKQRKTQKTKNYINSKFKSGKSKVSSILKKLKRKK